MKGSLAQTLTNVLTERLKVLLYLRRYSCQISMVNSTTTNSDPITFYAIEQSCQLLLPHKRQIYIKLQAIDQTTGTPVK